MTVNKPRRHLGEEHSRQRGCQQKKLEQEACLLCLKNSKDADGCSGARGAGRTSVPATQAVHCLTLGGATHMQNLGY